MPSHLTATTAITAQSADVYSKQSLTHLLGKVLNIGQSTGLKMMHLVQMSHCL